VVAALRNNRRAGSRKLPDGIPIAADQCFLFGSRPTLDLLLECDRALSCFELALPHELDRLARRCVSDPPVAVLLHAMSHVVSLARVVGTVRATQQVGVKGFHLSTKGEGFDKLSEKEWG
jgi:hypothetical protein